MNNVRNAFWLNGGLVALVLGAAGNAHAESFAEKCKNLQECAQTVGAITQQKYVFDGDLKGSFLSTPNLELTAANAERIFSLALHSNGFTRVPTGEKDVFWIARQRDARDGAVPIYEADEKSPPKLPETWDLITLRYKATNPEALELFARMLRNFVSAHARVLSNVLSKSIWITDSAPNVRKVYEMLKVMDVKPSPELKAQWAASEKADAEARKVRAIDDENLQRMESRMRKVFEESVSRRQEASAPTGSGPR
ncbi:MAG: hypothetical protein AAB425_00620 [Bdellovibrionota bacterium]